MGDESASGRKECGLRRPALGICRGGFSDLSRKFGGSGLAGCAASRLWIPSLTSSKAKSTPPASIRKRHHAFGPCSNHLWSGVDTCQTETGARFRTCRAPRARTLELGFEVGANPSAFQPKKSSRCKTSTSLPRDDLDESLAASSCNSRDQNRKQDVNTPHHDPSAQSSNPQAADCLPETRNPQPEEILRQAAICVLAAELEVLP